MGDQLINTAEEQILEHMEQNGQKLSWLAEKIPCSVSHLHFVLKGNEKTKRPLTDDYLSKINAALGTSIENNN